MPEYQTDIEDFTGPTIQPDGRVSTVETGSASATNLPANLSVAQARLPATYESAKQALAECNRIDECQDWADKAEALASYARQAEDDTMRKMADRIQARAVRRCGELLKTFNSSGGRPSKTTDGTVSSFSQKQAAQQAGLSERQQVTAVRVANVPTETFEQAVESDNPPTVTKLAEAGTKSRPKAPEPPPPVVPQNFSAGASLIGALRRFAEFCSQNDPTEMAEAMLPEEAATLRKQVQEIDAWLDCFVVNLKG